MWKNKQGNWVCVTVWLLLDMGYLYLYPWGYKYKYRHHRCMGNLDPPPMGKPTYHVKVCIQEGGSKHREDHILLVPPVKGEQLSHTPSSPVCSSTQPRFTFGYDIYFSTIFAATRGFIPHSIKNDS